MKASDMKLVRTRVGAIQISTDPSPIERRVGLLCAVAKLNMGVYKTYLKNKNVKSVDNFENW